MYDKTLITHCSPTLAGLKLGSIFTLYFNNKEEPANSISSWNNLLNCRGVHFELLRLTERTALIYVYRPKLLLKRLNCPKVAGFLEQHGYTTFSIKACLDLLKLHLLQGDSFPHEIGIFLDYPLEDVIGFIENNGRNCKCVGPWKVYCNEWEAQKTFFRYKKCKDVYLRLFQAGRSVELLTPAL